MRIELIIFKNVYKEYRFDHDPVVKTPPILYVVSLLSFIPLIGFFVGIVVWIFGYYKYRNWTIVYLGIGGMLFTVGFYSYLVYQAKNNPLVKLAQESVERDYLNDLVKDVELYKVKFGHYPLTLGRLRDDGKGFFPGRDPKDIEDLKNYNRTNYYYELTDSGYYLFARGKDGLAFTSDDVHPSVSDPNKSLGLIRK